MMSSSLPTPSTENSGCLNADCMDANSSKNEITLERAEAEEEDEEGDLDFNPFPHLEEPSPSLSSELECLESADIENGDEIVMQTLPTRNMKRKLAVICEPDNATTCEGDGSGMGIVLVNDAITCEEDAICKRTRARYSLASFTLDELETFLQETDDEDDLPNIDDQEEYRKFLAAVLQGGNSGSASVQGNENVDEEDEDNDADFELEIEEALESDVEENIKDWTHEYEYEEVVRRPETRQNKRHKASLKKKKKPSEPLNRPLRPLIPYAPIAPFPPHDLRHMMIESAPDPLSFSTQTGIINIFTPHQIGQLHCLIHEHVQLLIQVFSLSVLEPSQQHTATQVQGLILELLRNRDQSLASRRISYPSFCFSPPYIHPSVVEQSPQILGSSACDTERNVNFWVPFLSGPVLSVIDVAPLNSVGCYLDDVSTAVQEYRRRQLFVSCDINSDKEPLFPYQSFQASTQGNDDFSKESISPNSKRVPSSASDRTPKKTIAATLVERAKMQSITPVPKGISKLAQRFFPLFNPALFPHKPPPPSVANRVLFTAAEDGLLARGLMEFNMDCKKIQEHYLPCKTEHQIYVRQKNRACSRAPDNPIKAVRMMKNSPLTAEEKARIEEALKVYKLDWVSICKYVVPHRDPSLLPRQWRTAIGTQKSYKADEDKKARRRLYDSRRRNDQPMVRGKTSPDKEDGSTGKVCGENNSGDDCVDNEDEAYVHEAFLADWRPGTSSELIENIGSEFPAPSNRSVPISHTVSNLSSRSHQSRIILPPYRSRRTDSHRVVKLAPDLPPVNLPPSVRVMSQSAFKIYQEKVLNKASAANKGSWGPAKEISSLPCAMNLEATQEERNPSEKDGSDLHMHPLLFQTPGNGSLPYYPLDGIKGASSSFNFFQKNPPQLNIGLFNNTRHMKETVNVPSNSSSIDFHPLLQRTDDTNFDSVTAHSEPSSTSELLRAPLEQFQNPIDVLTNSRANELDLDISLSLEARKEKENRNLDKGNLKTSMGNSQEAGITEFSTTRISPRQHCSSSPNLDENGNILDVNRNNMNDIGENSLPDIVMEEEELSDSEEELGENVEFECEEMADSEGEAESNSGQIDNVQIIKETRNSSVEKALTQADNPSSSLYLSLNSCSPPLPKAKLPVRRNPRNYGTSRSSKSTTPQEIHLDPVAVTPRRKPRKGAQKCDFRASTGQASKRDASTNTIEKSHQSC